MVGISAIIQFSHRHSFHLQSASDIRNIPDVAVKAKRRSGCPLSTSLDIFGDRWSLLIVRDMMVRGYRTFKEFQTAGEGIATNILSDRLEKLQAVGILCTEPDPEDGRKIHYRLTEKGIDLAAVLLEIVVWGAQHEKTATPAVLVQRMTEHREAFLAETRRRWRDRDPMPMIPKSDMKRSDMKKGK
jgi:DNA-binding HxlR family transcriptional regulator